MSKPIIEVTNISKKFNIGRQSADLRQTVREFFSASKNYKPEIWALKDINFTVEEGEVLGLIGPNGSGKSTLLKILSRITYPTTGKAVLRGRVSSLLEVGTGFHPELTGRENIFLNGSILGMKKAEIKKKFDEIVDFSGVEQFIDTPVKHFSSGMYVRLAFSVAAHLEPEILLVDEVLSVGDSFFQNKAIKKLNDLTSRLGLTVLLVSHNLQLLSIFTNKAILLIDGKIKTHGNLDYAIDLYLSENRINSQMFFAKSELKRNQIKSITLKDPINDLPKKRFFMNENIKVEIEVISDKILENFDLSLRLNDQINTKIASWRSSELGIKLNMDYSKSIIIIIKNLNVFEGIYNFSVSLTKNDLTLDFIENAIEFEILPAPVILKNKIIPKYNCLIYTESEWIC